VKVALVYPPSCDPTAPYLSLPTLTGFLREHGVEVTPIDANVEAYDHLLRRDTLERLAERLWRRLERLERSARLSHVEQLAYVALCDARADAQYAPGRIDAAVALLRGQRGRDAFFDAERYAQAIASVDSALRLIAAVHTPLVLDFVRYRTPFSLLSAEEIAADAEPARNPFHEFFSGPLAARIRAEQVGLVGLSVVFPGQIQPAYSLAHALRRHAPDVHLTVGGPAITQLYTRLEGRALERALGPFHSAILFEGEVALLEHVRALERGEPRSGVYKGTQAQSMAALPAPDFRGLPLDRYLSPELVLPYDPTRGCYWGVCTFCHYGLAEVGTAGYRERPLAHVLEHLRALAERHDCRLFYFSQDSVSPKTMLRIAREIRAAGLPWRWATDMRPERSLTPERCQELVAGGALAMALGVESAAPRVLALIDKGVPVDTVRNAIQNLAGAGVAVEAMCFTDFPTETYREALATLEFLDEQRGDLSLFICGEFDLTHGSLVAQKPEDFGIRRTWQIEGDELGTGLFYEERRRKSDDEREQIDDVLSELSAKWRLSHYPWAGALSTAHTLLWYEHHGPQIFKELADAPAPEVPRFRGRPLRYDLETLRTRAQAREADIWDTLVNERGRVSRADYRALAEGLPPAHPRPQALRRAQRAEGERSRAGRRAPNGLNSTRPER
jgi:anaerobic magnesium-protoporphyrin IX monomethyl ester cyclase